MTEIITNIGELTTNDPDYGRLANAAILIEDGLIEWVGPASSAPDADNCTDAENRAILPGWVDTHTHLVFAGDRSTEFEARMAGQKYSAGGIISTVIATRAASEEVLRNNAQALRREAELQGTTYLETKTGYGLTVDSERTSARVGSEIADVVTFLGAHLVPPGIDRRDYLDLVTGPMLAAVLPYVQFIDVFCEAGAFSVDEAAEILRAGVDAGLRTRVHGNQLGHSGGVALAVEMGAASVDHCNHLSQTDIDLLAQSVTVATFLPACDLSTQERFGPAREVLDAGGTIALATNCNPGSSYTTSMPFCVATAVLQMHLTIEEAVYAATRGGAIAVGCDDVGIVKVGARANLQMLDAPSISHLAYRPGVALTAGVWRDGVRTVGERLK